ncbi:YihY/virulence factor BrkB family protein [Euzebya sp.]|uniref:YihY/virulence factor BrkB family protein n=1 Tax=Euzebya sp. TaxID=1971409 RepID=UPI00351548EE
MLAPLDRLVDRLPPRGRAGVDLAVATVRDSAEDRVVGLAAEVAFWVLLSLPPLLLTVVSAAGVIGRAVGEDVRTQLVGRIEELAGQVFTAATVERAVTPTLDAVVDDGATSVLSFSFLVAVFTASRVLRVLIHAITIAYDLEEARPSWMARVLGLVFTIVGLVLGVVLIPVVVAGPRLGTIIEERLGIDMALGTVWRLAYWPLSLLVITLLIATLYHYATPWRTPFRRELPGAALATTLGLAASVLLRVYTAQAFSADTVYAPLAAPLAILLWVFLIALALLLGAELNAEIEKADPVGEPPDEPPPTLGDLSRRAVAGIRGLTPGGS